MAGAALAVAASAAPPLPVRAQGAAGSASTDTIPRRLDGGRFSIVAMPQDARLARALLAQAVSHDTFPGLPRPVAHVIIIVAPDARHFRAWTGPAVPEWGAAVAFPERQRVVVQGQGASSAAGDPSLTLRHELAHLALHEYLDDLPPRWFDEGYANFAAGAGAPDDILATNVALAFHGVPTLAALDTGLVGRENEAGVSYALATRAVRDLAGLDRAHGLSLLFQYWRASGSLDVAVRRAYGEPLDVFEAHWQATTRRRYGALAVLSDLSFATLVFLTLLLPLYVARRRRDRRRLGALRDAERAVERAEPAEPADPSGPFRPVSENGNEARGQGVPGAYDPPA